MGTVAGGGASGEEGPADAPGDRTRRSFTSATTCSEKLSAGISVYQLVRVEGDGRLVPATDDELMEVEHMLQDCNSEIPPAESPSQGQDCELISILSSKNAILDGSENRQLLHQASHPPAYDVKSQAENTLLDTDTQLSAAIQGNGGTELKPEADEPLSSTPDASDNRLSLNPDFSLLKGDICLDKLTIRELQETFRAAFGRQTSVKDKLWLKRRITMGLTNSCDVPTTSFILREKRITQDKAHEESQAQADSTKHDTDLGPGDFQKLPLNHACKMEGERLLPGKRLRMSYVDFTDKNEDVNNEQVGNKRVRKPTKRYIEELSELDIRECSGRIATSKDSDQVHSSPEFQQRRIHNVEKNTVFVTRLDSLGGCGVRIPYVSRVRRGRPRKDFMALVGISPIQRDKPTSEVSTQEKQVIELNNLNILDSAEKASMDSTLKSGHRRKHHRAWTLAEVLKLVEGVSRYGAGRWSEIKRLDFASFTYRTSVDLKDKWRNLIKASFSQGLVENGAQNSRKLNSTPIPAQILVRVRKLAEMHTQVGAEFGPGKPTGYGGTVVDKGSGFL